MRQWSKLAAPILCLMVSLACRSGPKMDLPLYPGAAGMPSGGDVESPEGTMFHAMFRTPANRGAVAGFYARELVEKRGWTQEGGGLGPVFTDGNLTVSGFGRGGDGKAEDPSKTGGLVQMMESPEATVIDVWQWVPKAAK